MGQIKLIVIGAALLANLAGYGLVAWRAYNLGQDRQKALYGQAQAKDTQEKIKIKEKQDEIRNNRPDLVRVADRMLKRVF